MKLLIVDTDRDQVEMLTNWLRTLGYEVYHAYTGKHASQVWMLQQPDLVIIDPALKDMDGLTLCQEMRIRYDTLVLVMMYSSNVQDEIRCLESGVDDYLCKPFFPTQFLARLRALSRRGRPTLRQQSSSIIAVGNMRVDFLHNEATVDTRTVRLTPIESKLLHLLAMNANNVCTTNQIVSHLWGFGNDGDGSLIKAHICHLRQKIERDAGNPTYIRTILGVGYTLIASGHEKSRDYVNQDEDMLLKMAE
ncbi:MAG TPA: response regulator transcription factor [Ktedonobacteraceae bacterium]